MIQEDTNINNDLKEYEPFLYLPFAIAEYVVLDLSDKDKDVSNYVINLYLEVLVWYIVPYFLNFTSNLFYCVTSLKSKLLKHINDYKETIDNLFSHLRERSKICVFSPYKYNQRFVYMRIFLYKLLFMIIYIIKTFGWESDVFNDAIYDIFNHYIFKMYELFYNSSTVSDNYISYYKMTFYSPPTPTPTPTSTFLSRLSLLLNSSLHKNNISATIPVTTPVTTPDTGMNTFIKNFIIKNKNKNNTNYTNNKIIYDFMLNTQEIKQTMITMSPPYNSSDCVKYLLLVLESDENTIELYITFSDILKNICEQIITNNKFLSISDKSTYKEQILSYIYKCNISVLYNLYKIETILETVKEYILKKDMTNTMNKEAVLFYIINLHKNFKLCFEYCKQINTDDNTKVEMQIGMMYHLVFTMMYLASYDETLLTTITLYTIISFIFILLIIDYPDSHIDEAITSFIHFIYNESTPNTLIPSTDIEIKISRWTSQLQVIQTVVLSFINKYMPSVVIIRSINLILLVNDNANTFIQLLFDKYPEGISIFINKLNQYNSEPP